MLKGIGVVRGMLAVIVAIGIFGYVGIPSFQGMVNTALNPILQGGPSQIVDNIRRIVAPAPSQVTPRPGDLSASSQLEDHPARLIADGFSNTDWQGTDKAPEVTVAFETPIDLMSVIVNPGNAEAFADFRRPKVLEFVLPDGSTKRVDLEDAHEPQTFEVGGDGIDQLVIRVIETRGPEEAPISISEIEFFEKS
jgi:hypothetical protein